MSMNRSISIRLVLLIAFALTLTWFSSRLKADTGTCGGVSLTLPFTDVPGTNVFFCSIAQAFFTGLTNGTTPTTFSPSANVPREQMAAFITRTQDSALKRGSRRAYAGQWWRPNDAGVLKATTVGSSPQNVCFDGEDLWVANSGGNSVTRVRASDGRALGTWTGAIQARNTIAAAGFIYVTGFTNPGRIYRIDPSQAAGAVIEVENNLGANPVSITFDGLNLWTANLGTLLDANGSITRYSILTDTETTFGTGFNQPSGIVFDGTHLWVVDSGNNALHRIDPADGLVLETLDMGQINSITCLPAFDGSNIWVPVDFGLKVVRPSTPAQVLASLTGNGLDASNPVVAYDGERIMVTNARGISLWKATSLTPLGSLNLVPGEPRGVCSDGLHFWIVIDPSVGADSLLRF